MYSDNIFSLALDSGWWDGKETFRFCYVYAPDSRALLAARRREWRVFDLLAPSLKLDPNMENYPFSIKPDTLVSLEKMMTIFKDYYEGTEYDLRKNITVKGDSGKTVISPLANPFMTVDELKLHKVNGGWHHYVKIYCRSLYDVCNDYSMQRLAPDEIGGLVWLPSTMSLLRIVLLCSVTICLLLIKQTEEKQVSAKKLHGGLSTV